MGVVSIDLDQQIELSGISEGLTEIIQRVDKFMVLPNAANLPAAEVKKRLKEKRDKAIAEVAARLPVTDEESMLAVGAIVTECVTIRAGIVGFWAEAKDLAHRAHKRLCDLESRDLESKDIIREAADRNINAFRMKQEEDRRAEERRVQQLAQEEQRRLLAESERQFREKERLEAVAREAKRAGDMATARIANQEAALAVQQAEVLEEKAVAVLDEVVHAPAPVAKIAGRVEKWPWVGTVVDPKALIKAIAAGEVPLEHTIPVRGGGEQTVPLVEFNDAVIQYYAKRLEANARIPGCEFKETLQSAQRRG